MRMLYRVAAAAAVSEPSWFCRARANQWYIIQVLIIYANGRFTRRRRDAAIEQFKLPKPFWTTRAQLNDIRRNDDDKLFIIIRLYSLNAIYAHQRVVIRIGFIDVIFVCLLYVQHKYGNSK